MNKQEADILNAIISEQYVNQRNLSEVSGHSLGVVNRSLKNLIQDGYLNECMCVTAKAVREVKDSSPQNAIILAAGFGMRMIPINTQFPKALLKIKGEILIERIINQLHEVGIHKIYIVVGYLKEQFEYLIDKFGVELIVNELYAEKNNLHSLNLASKHLSNTYIIPGDLWCNKNFFHRNELYSWYMVNDLMDDDSSVRVNRKNELTLSTQGGNHMIGIAYLAKQQSELIRERLGILDGLRRYDGAFWEESLVEDDRMIVYGKVVQARDVIEINTYEQLRELDEDSCHLKSEAMDVIIDVLKTNQKEIKNIEVLKKGMTNRSFVFTCKNSRYIMRIPGEGTDNLINREQETLVYDVLRGKGLCDDPVYINAKNGYKLTKYLEGVRTCDSTNNEDLIICMKKLKEFHDMDLQVEHTFDLFGQIDFYESLWGKTSSVYKDYKITKEHVFSLKDYIEKNRSKWCLTHIDAIPDNFLFCDGRVQLTDWEYAGMQDPHVDLAMFCIYSLYDREQVDNLINIYFEGDCSPSVRIKIYCYIAVCGLLWSNWCEYKRKLGVEFGEYSLRQYRYAKDYYRIVMEELADESK